MHISRRTLTVSILTAVLILVVCGIVYFLSSQNLAQTGGAPPPAATSQPGGVQPTAPLSTSISPELTVLPALPEQRRLTLEFPPRLRAGDSDVVRLTLEVDNLGNVTPTAEVGGNVVTGQTVEIPNLYESHHVIAEARFDIAGLEVRPSDLVSEALSPGNAVTFRWSIRPVDVGTYRGTIWFYLRFVDKSSGDESRKTVSAQTVEIQAVNFLGLSANLARTGGVVGSVVGTIIGFPFLEDILKFILKRLSGQKK